MGVVYFSIIPTFEPSRYCKCWIVCFHYIFWNRQRKNQNLADKQIALTKGGTLNLTILTLDGYGVQIQSRGVNVLLNTSIGWKYEMTPAEFPRKILFHLLE